MDPINFFVVVKALSKGREEHSKAKLHEFSSLPTHCYVFWFILNWWRIKKKKKTGIKETLNMKRTRHSPTKYWQGFEIRSKSYLLFSMHFSLLHTLMAVLCTMIHGLFPFLDWEKIRCNMDKWILFLKQNSRIMTNHIFVTDHHQQVLLWACALL